MLENPLTYVPFILLCHLEGPGARAAERREGKPPFGGHGLSRRVHGEAALHDFQLVQRRRLLARPLLVPQGRGDLADRVDCSRRGEVPALHSLVRLAQLVLRLALHLRRAR